MRKITTLGALALWAGCTGDPNQLGGDEWTAVPTLGDSQTELSGDGGGTDNEPECTPEFSDPELSAEVDGDDVVLTHSGLAAVGCSTWEIKAENTAEYEMTVTYEDTHTEGCDDTCYWTLIYTLADAPPGEWTIHAQGNTVKVTVD